ncbi:HTH_Tnp_Tc3_2 domain-containing protein [Trichonephila clavipes]|nr:HTH_Tnp_Tc3_2 domain-containing protein [Trichonephila clavipes]
MLLSIISITSGIMGYVCLTEFERGCVKGLREGRFYFHHIAERLGRNVFTVHDCWEQWSRDGTASKRPGSRRLRSPTKREYHRVRRTAVAHRTSFATEIQATVYTTVTQRTIRNRLLHGAPSQKPCNLYSTDLKLEFIKGRSGDLLCFMMKAGSALLPVIAVCWSEGYQRNACYQTVCVLNTLNLRLESWSEEQFSTIAGVLSYL